MMRKRKLTMKLLAGIFALGMTVSSLFTGCTTQAPTEQAEASTPTVTDTDTESREEATAELTVLCPELTTAADAFLLLSEGHAMLIDTGEDLSAHAVLSLMEQYGIETLDELIITHLDKDHIGGAAEILNQIPVKTLYRTAFETDSAPYTALLNALNAHPETEAVILTETKELTLGSVSVTLYPPLESSYSKAQDNNSSIITSIICKNSGNSLLFMGDAEKARIKEFLAEQYDGTDYHFLKVPHHGRDTKTLNRLLKQFVPDYALITSSRDEPEKEALLSALAQQGTQVWLTREGTVTVTCGKDGITVTQEDD